MESSKGVAIGSAVSGDNVEPNHCFAAESNDDQWLIVSKRDSKSRLLPRRMIFVGRQDCDICVPSTTVDMRHAVLFFNGHHFHIKDLNSAYGTYVNDKRIAGQCYVRLQHSDRLRFGFGPDLFILEKISSLPLTPSAGCDTQLNSGDMESADTHIKPQINNEIISDKRIENSLKEGLTTPVSRLSCHSNSSLSNSVDSLDDIKCIKLFKDSKIGNISEKKEEIPKINEEMTKEVTTGLTPSTPAPDSLESVDSFGSPTAFIITLDDDDEKKKKMNIKDSIRKFAPPKPDSIEKQRPKSARNESIKCNENQFTNQKSPTNRSKRLNNALSANKTTKVINKVVNTPTSIVADVSAENGGHLSDSATYLINRMLSNRTPDNLIQTNMRPNNISPVTAKGTYGEKADSGLSDDIKSDSGNTYTVDENNEELEDARKKIDQVFGVDDSATVSLNSSPDSSLTLNSPTLLMNFEEKLSKTRQSFGSPKFDRKMIASDSEVKPQNSNLVSNNSTFTRTKRRVPTVEEMLHKVETKLTPIGDKTRNSSHIFSNDLNRKECNSSHISQIPSINEIQNNNNNINYQFRATNSQSAPSTPRSPLVSRKLVELRMNSRQNQKALNNNRRKNSWNSDMDFYESYNSDESTDHSHRSSNSALSKEGGNASSASVPSKINFNRAFALRRARLGIETPGIDVTPNKVGLSRNDGGRFSLRVAKKDVNDSSKKLGNRISSKEKLNNNSVQRKGSDPFGTMKSTTNRCQPVMSSVSDTDRRNALNSNRFNQLNNRLRHNYNLNNNTNLSKNDINLRQKTFTDSEISVSQRSKQISANSGQQMTTHLNNFNNRRNESTINRESSMSSSLTEPSHKPPINNFQTKNVIKSGLELTALDGLVVSAINQLSQKLKNNLTELMESQRSKHPTSSQARCMIDEVLPQLAAPDRRLNDNSISVSRDLSAILKNLKKMEQSIDVVSHLLEPNTTKAHNSCRKQSNDFFVVDV